MRNLAAIVKELAASDSQMVCDTDKED